MKDTENNVIKYQWIKGENLGKIEQVKETKDNFIIFESNRRVNTNLLDEFMVLVNSDADILEIESPKVIDIESVTGIKFEGNNKLTKKTFLENKEKININPIRKLLEKQSKNNKINIPLEFKINLPKKEIIEILQDGFDDDIINEMILYAKDTLNKNKILEEINSKIEEVIKSYYI